MPDSIREVLQGIPGDSGPSRDLAAGAYRRAHAIARRRLATIAVTVIAALAMAGGATAVMVDRDGTEQAPPAAEPTAGAPTVAEQPMTAEETTEMEPEEVESVAECDVPEGWTGWGASESMRDLDTLPDGLVFESYADGAVPESVFVQFEGDDAVSVLEAGPFAGAYFMAPDGNRYVAADAAGCAGALGTRDGEWLDWIAAFSGECAPSWSPDSNQVVLNVAETEGGYLLDVATGAVGLDLPAEVGCSPRWSADGKYLVSADGSVAMRPDASTERVELHGAEVWGADPEFTGVSSVSADLGWACLQYDAPDSAQSGEVRAERCDRFVDTKTGEVKTLPVETERASVVFLPDGGFIVCDDRYSEIRLTLVSKEFAVVDSRTFPGQNTGGTFLRGYFTD